jgi:hypothetical protein
MARFKNSTRFRPLAGYTYWPRLAAEAKLAADTKINKQPKTTKPRFIANPRLAILDSPGSLEQQHTVAFGNGRTAHVASNFANFSYPIAVTALVSFAVHSPFKNFRARWII